MITKCIDEINNYFGTAYPNHEDGDLTKLKLCELFIARNKSIFRMEEVMRLITRIQEKQFIVNIEDITTLDVEPVFRIWFNIIIESNLQDGQDEIVECSYGQVRTGYAPSGIKDDLIHLLVYSISEWCKYNKTA